MCMYVVNSVFRWTALKFAPRGPGTAGRSPYEAGKSNQREERVKVTWAKGEEKRNVEVCVCVCVRVRALPRGSVVHYRRM